MFSSQSHTVTMEFALADVLIYIYPLLLPILSTQATYHIKPTSESPCPYQDCLTLSEYATETSRYTNSNNLTLLFLPGEHVLNTSIVFQFLDSLSLLGDQLSLPNITSKIICNETSAFELVSISLVEINSLALMNCGGQNGSSSCHTTPPSVVIEGSKVTVLSAVPAIVAQFVPTFHLIHCHMESNNLPVLLNNSRMYSRDSMFAGNTNGAVAAYSSTVLLLRKNTFLDNKAVVGGGVFAHNSELVVSGRTLYTNNTAEYGGGISAINSTVCFESAFYGSMATDFNVSIERANNFYQNVAIYDGGGILLVTSNMTQNGGLLKFTGNRADSGGAISSHQSNISLNGSAMFERNSAEGLGGAVSVRNGTWSSAIVSFVGNSAQSSGGAVYAADSNIKFGTHTHTQTAPIVTSAWISTSSYYSVFMNNFATANGGGIEAERSVIMIGGTSMSETGMSANASDSVYAGQIAFTANRALKNGGGIFVYNSSTLCISGSGIYVDNVAGKFGGAISARANNTVVIDGENTFAGNTALCGGGIAITGSDRVCLFMGVPIPSTGSSALLSGNLSFLSNGADHEGGGVYLSLCSAQIHGNVTCVGNTAHNSGGGMYIDRSILNISGNELYITNAAHNYGGGMSVHSSNLTMSGISVYINNTAMETKGGMIQAQYSHIQYRGKLTFATNQARTSGGGIFLEIGSTLKVTGSGSYVRNIAKQGRGGAINVESDCHLVLEGESLFTRNYADYGGGVAIKRSTGLLLGKTSLISNTASVHGGGLYITQSWARRTLTISGTGTYTNNTAGELGGVIAVTSSTLMLDSKHTFSSNVAASGAAIAATFNSVVMNLGKINSFNNRATTGGVIHLQDSSLSVTGNATYINNTASGSGGVIHLQDSSLSVTGNATYINNTASGSGGVIFGSGNSTIFLDGRNAMVKNCAEKHGGAIALEHCKIQINGKVMEESIPWIVKEFYCEDNMVNHSGGALYATESHVELSGVTSFVNNMAKVGGFGGGIHAVGTDILLTGLHEFRNNSASYGGGMAIESYLSNGFLNISRNAVLSFLENCAHKHGGGLFVKNIAEYTCPPSESISEKYCFIGLGTHDDLPHVRLPSGRYRNVTKCIGHVVFEGNIANDGGHTLFGEAIYDCRVDIRIDDSCENSGCREQTCYMSGIEVVAALAHLSVHDLTRDPFNVMSDTYKVCPCDSEKPNCKQRTSHYTTYPGETVLISVTVVGKVNLIASVANVIHAKISEEDKVWLDKRQDTQAIDVDCTFLEYTLFSSGASSAKLTLSVEGPCQTPGIPFFIHVNFSSCPIGFVSQSGSCVCEQRLQKYTNSCNINTRSITRNRDFWVGFDHHSHGLILHPHCSFDYCKLETVSFTLNSTDLQCGHGRSGKLRGACKSGYSLNLGSSRCSSCSNVFLILFIPFATAGFLLVVFLFICKVTVAIGTTSGLIFYANILAVNKSVFFPENETNVLTVFIAWLNLDLGIETCFIDGMDMYTRTWLQFVFPLYIWIQVGIIVLVSRRSTFFARIIGPTNPVSVLATLFLLSYTKLLRTIIATLSFTILDYPDDKSVTVWVYDGNIEYFKGKHIPLFLAGLLALLLLFLPYTLLLLFGQWFEAGSNHKLLSWINKPTITYFLDAYHAPYKNQYRYWTGLLLLVRFVLFIISAVVDINSPRDPSINFLILGIICAGLTILVWNMGSIFKKQHSNILESSFILNLTILALSSLYVRVEEGNQTAVVYTSLSIAFVTFLGIITFHVVELLRDSRFWRITVVPKLQRLRWIAMHHEEQHDDNAVEMTAPPTAPSQAVPTTFVELREPLLESQH